ncbi:hypothetical protein MUK42_20633 [Musa troglodytarum]|nr:hypothetical protein MUK42_20633 [Musa troglodytarum]
MPRLFFCLLSRSGSCSLCPPPRGLRFLRPRSPTSASMGSEVAVVGELPQLPPLEMTAVDAELEECATPRSEEPVLVCPPAPRKPRPAKRPSPESPPREFFPVPRDLASVFLPLPPTKRIRVV